MKRFCCPISTCDEKFNKEIKYFKYNNIFYFCIY